MLVRDVLAASRRRWWAVLLGLAATVGMVIAATFIVHPSYEAKADVLLLPPASSIEAGGNPYLQLGSLRQAVDLVVVAVSDQRSVSYVKAISETAEYEVVADPRTSSPTVLITVTDTSPARALEVRDAIVKLIPQRLAQLQQDIQVEPERQVTSTLISADTTAERVGQAQLRAAIAAGLGGLTLTFLCAALLDNLLDRRARRLGELSGDAE